MKCYASLALPFALWLAVEGASRRTDGQRIQGTWIISAVTEDGRDAAPARDASVRVVIQGDTLAMRDRDGTTTARFRIDQSRNPKRIETMPASGPFKGQMLAGLYQLDGDRLLLCLPSRPDQEMPTDLSARAGSSRILLTLQRDIDKRLPTPR